TRDGAVDAVDDKRNAEAQKHRRPLSAHRVDQRGECQRRAGGGENVHREGAGADEHAILDRHARVLTRAAIIRSCYSPAPIPPNFIACHLVNVFGPKTHSQARRCTGSFYRVPPNWVAKMVANRRPWVLPAGVLL